MQQNFVKYFASRNGFDGFTSYFHQVFDPSKYTKIFILKGGPGTGKSTLMKRLHEEFSQICDNSESILCSSDTSSYDGLILERDGRRIAFIDGTAPHMSDPILPVVCEEILNLATAIAEPKISKHRKELEALYSQKKSEYQLAYHFLLVCGEINRNYSAVYQAVDETQEEGNLFYLLENLPYAGSNGIKRRLYTSFGKDGFYQIQFEKEDGGRCLLFNRGSSASRLLLGKLEEHNTESVFIINCFDGAVDRVEIPSLSLTVKFAERKEIDPSLLSIYTEALEIARVHFENAAQAHFAMEDIYRNALKFNELDEIFFSVKEKTKVLLSIS